MIAWNELAALDGHACLVPLCVLLALCGACRADPGSFRELVVQGDGVTLRARVKGNPEPGNVLIALHGGPGGSSDEMVPLGQLASDELAVVIYDQRGAGRSSAPPEEIASYALERYVADLEAVREAVGAGEIHLLGHSWGGLVVLRYATVHPKRVRSLLLAASGAPKLQALQAAGAALSARIAGLQDQGVIPRELPADVADRAEATLPALLHDPGFRWPEGMTMRINATAMQLTTTALGEFDFTAEISKLSHRMLVVWGEDDPFREPMGGALKAALSGADAEYVLLRGCGHFWQESSEAFVSRIRAFLGSLPAASAGR